MSISLKPNIHVRLFLIRMLSWCPSINSTVGTVVVQRVMEGKGCFGLNAETWSYEYLMMAGIVDPTKVTRFALQNAASGAGLLMTTEAVVAEKPKKG